MKLSNADISAAGEELYKEGKVTFSDVVSAWDSRTEAEAGGDTSGYSASFGADIFNQSSRTASELAAVTDNTGDGMAAAIFNDDSMTAATVASIMDDANLSEEKGSDILENTNLAVAKINDIITHDNIGDSRAQQFVGNTDPVTRDLTDATSIYEFLDDWDDNKLSDRDDADVTATGFTDLFAQLDHFRPEWYTESGSPSATGGELVLPAGDTTNQTISILTTFFVGTWEVDEQKQGDGTTGNTRACEWRLNGDTKYSFLWRYDDAHMVYDSVDSTSIVSATHAEDTAWHTRKCTRDSVGNWEIFFDGASDGTTTDTTTTSTDELRISNIEDIETHFDNYKVY